MRIPVPMWAILAWFPLAASAQPSDVPGSGVSLLARAVELLEVPDYAGARAVLERGLATEGNDRQTLISLHELRGVVAASLRDQDAALESFRRVLVLEPDFRPARDYSPRVNGPFLEARAWLAEHAPLRFAPLPPLPDRGVIRSLGATVLSDPLNLGRSVRFHLRAPDGAWSIEEAPLAKQAAHLPLAGPISGWWAELIGDHTAVLSRIGSPEKPIVEGGLAAFGGLASLRPHQWWAVGLAGGALVAGGVGGLFGLQAEGARQQIASAARDPVTGVIIGMTQPRAFELERQAQTQAVIANVLFASGAALAVGAGTMWFLGGQVQLAPNGVRGSFP
ncbi:MAG: hypothetical protein M3Y59_18550 [Myxococcota bacterium]|nr:hypothetical protein [Myxococcota bacterium]